MNKIEFNNSPIKRTKREVVGEAQSAGAYELTPVAQLSTMQWQHPDGNAAGAYAHLSPTEVIVRGPNGEERVPLPIPTKNALVGMLAGAFAIAAVCSTLIVIVTLWAARKR